MLGGSVRRARARRSTQMVIISFRSARTHNRTHTHTQMFNMSCVSRERTHAFTEASIGVRVAVFMYVCAAPRAVACLWSSQQHNKTIEERKPFRRERSCSIFRCWRKSDKEIVGGLCLRRTRLLLSILRTRARTQMLLVL